VASEPKIKAFHVISNYIQPTVYNYPKIKGFHVISNYIQPSVLNYPKIKSLHVTGFSPTQISSNASILAATLK
jgi:hypothetical protein